MRIGSKIGAVLALAACCSSASAAHAASVSGFSIVASPVLAHGGTLTSVAAVSASDVWAVGAQYDSSAYQSPLSEHWNGSSWSVVPTPAQAFDSILLSVSAARGAVWAVGETAGADRVFAIHRNGTAWVQAPKLPRSFVRVGTVQVVSDTDVWCGGISARHHHVIYHWNGAAWAKVKDAEPTSGGLDETTGLAAAGGEVLAAGYREDPTTTGWLESYSGGTWMSLGASDLRGGYTTEASASSTSNVWVVGYRRNPKKVLCRTRLAGTGSRSPKSTPWLPLNLTLAERRRSHQSDECLGGRIPVRQCLEYVVHADRPLHGLRWVDLGGPNVGTQNGLFEVTVVPGAPSDLWAVGYASGQPLTLHHT